jgi:DNA polymerase I
MPPTLYLIDGHALAYRMYFALTAGGGGSQRWQTSKGEPTAGIYGFARELLRILEQEKPEYIAVAFDVGKTFRDELFPEYKATREKMPDDLRPQIERIRQMVDAFNIPRLEMEGFEADDVLGSVARIAAEQGLGVKIVTGDRDLLQLVDKRTVVYLAGDDQNYIKDEDVVKKLGVLPKQVVDYKALVGDKSDNIPGVAGVGEKTAIACSKNSARSTASTNTSTRSKSAGRPNSRRTKGMPTSAATWRRSRPTSISNWTWNTPKRTNWTSPPSKPFSRRWNSARF